MGPPGTKRVTAKTSKVIPMKVGMISSRRRIKYEVITRSREYYFLKEAGNPDCGTPRIYNGKASHKTIS
jgi:hypothetical protein